MARLVPLPLLGEIAFWGAARRLLWGAARRLLDSHAPSNSVFWLAPLASGPPLFKLTEWKLMLVKTQKLDFSKYSEETIFIYKIQISPNILWTGKTKAMIKLTLLGPSLAWGGDHDTFWQCGDRSPRRIHTP